MSVVKGIEGFSNWSSYVDGLGTGWTFPQSGNVAFVPGRFGGQALHGQGGNGCLIERALPSEQTAMWLGAAFCSDNYYNSNANPALIGLTTGGTPVLYLRQGGGTSNPVALWLIDAAGGTTSVSGFLEPAVNTWTYLEIGVAAGANGTGQVIVRQDSVPIGTFALSTVGTAAPYFDGLLFCAPYANAGGYLGDIY